MLRVENLCKSFGGVVATSDVTIEFPTGSLSAVIGPNGAGKTTFFNLISGALPPSSGRILLDGVNIVGQSSSDIVRLGIGRAFQVAKLFKTLTVEQSLRGALMSPLGKSLQLHGSFPLNATRDLYLSCLCLALVLDPKVLLLDEPVAGMGPEEREQMIETVYDLWQKGGLTVVLIEHDMEIVFRISQHIHVLSYGKVLAQGSAEEIRNNPAVIEAYLGTPQEAHA